MLGYSDIKELISAIGVPSSVVVLTISAFHYGIVPSLTSEMKIDVSDIKEKALLSEKRMDRHEQDVGHMIRQHAEQMKILNRALKEICLNTAKNEARSYKCVELDGTLSEKQ